MTTLEERVTRLEARVNSIEEDVNSILSLLRSVYTVVTTLSKNLDNLTDIVETRLGHSTSLTVFDALEDFRERLERIEVKLP